MEHFEWQTEEEGPLASVFDPRSGRRRRSWLAPVIVASLIGLGMVIFWQLGRQAEIRDQRVNDDLLAAFSVWMRAVVEKDSDMLGTLLMGGDAEWNATQYRLLQSGRLLGRDGMGLLVGQKPSLALEAEPAIDVDGNWRTAELTFPVTYYSTDVDPAGQAIALEQTLPLSREGSRWLLKRPDETFWGEWRVASGDQVEVTYRARDEQLATRFLADLETDLKHVCASSGNEAACPGQSEVTVRLESDPSVLLKLASRDRPAFSGRTFLLPTPTLVGKPLDEPAYRSLYRAYSQPVLETYAAMLAAPGRLPEQELAMLCLSRYGNGRRLYSYDPKTDEWQADLNGQAYRFMAADKADSRVVLRAHTPGEPNRLRLVQWSGAQATLTHDMTYDPLTEHQVGWLGASGRRGLLLASYRGTMRLPSYSLLDEANAGAEVCPLSGCDSQLLDGFPVWSPAGEHSLVLIGDLVYRADRDGRALAFLGEGYSPFWLDEVRYGFVRPAGSGNRQQIELVTGLAGQDELRHLWSTDALDRALSGIENTHPVFIQHVEVSGDQPQRLILYGRQYAGPESQYIFFSLPILAPDTPGSAPVIGAAQVELLLDSMPAGLPSAGDPNGHVPFILSPDGQWLTVANLDEKASNRWTIHVSQIDGDRAFQFSTHYPGYAFDHPFFDWSADGRWLLIIDEEFLRLVAPTLDFERIIAHDKRSCSYPAWVNWPSGEAAE